MTVWRRPQLDIDRCDGLTRLHEKMVADRILGRNSPEQPLYSTRLGHSAGRPERTLGTPQQAGGQRPHPDASCRRRQTLTQASAIDGTDGRRRGSSPQRPSIAERVRIGVEPECGELLGNRELAVLPVDATQHHLSLVVQLDVANQAARRITGDIRATGGFDSLVQRRAVELDGADTIRKADDVGLDLATPEHDCLTHDVHDHRIAVERRAGVPAHQLRAREDADACTETGSANDVDVLEATKRRTVKRGMPVDVVGRELARPRVSERPLHGGRRGRVRVSQHHDALDQRRLRPGRSAYTRVVGVHLHPNLRGPGAFNYVGHQSQTRATAFRDNPLVTTHVAQSGNDLIGKHQRGDLRHHLHAERERHHGHSAEVMVMA